jgi:hypothetical protein
MKPRIETVEVLSYRLKVPLTELEQLSDTDLGRELGLTLEYDGNELVLAASQADCAVRFRPIGAEAMLCEIAIARDEGGAFFEGVLLPLAARHRGDLHLRVVWNDGDRNTHGNWAEVKISHGMDESGRPLYAATLVGAAGEQVEPPESEPERPLTPEETAEQHEVERLLAKGRALWDQYQRAKAGK